MAALAEDTGGLVLTGRCHPAERSLFLQPFVDALRPVLLGAGHDPAALLDGHEAAWVSLLPDVAGLVETVAVPGGTARTQRRRAYDAVAAVLRRLSRRRPVLLVVDDLQDGGTATVDLLGYLAARLDGCAVLLLGAVREEDEQAVARLADRARRLPLGALPRSAVEAIASAAGLAVHGPAVMERTAGHSLSVVESLRALAAGDEGVPESLAAAVLARADRLDESAREVLRAASVLARRLDPRLLADLTDTTELVAVRHCETLTRARLMVRSGEGYEFANDLVQECVLRLAASRARRRLPPPRGRPPLVPARGDGRARLRRRRPGARGPRLAAGGRGGHAALGRRRRAVAVRQGPRVGRRPDGAGPPAARPLPGARGARRRTSPGWPTSRRRSCWPAARATAASRWPPYGRAVGTTRWGCTDRSRTCWRTSRRGWRSRRGWPTVAPRPTSPPGSPPSRPAACTSRPPCRGRRPGCDGPARRPRSRRSCWPSTA